MEDNSPNLGNPVEPSTESMPTPQTPPSKPAWYKSKAFIISIIVVLLAAGGAAAWFVLQPKDDSSQSQDQSSNNKDNKQVTEQAPYAVAYGYKTEGAANANGCKTSQTTSYWRPLAGGDRIKATDFGSGNEVYFSDVYKNKVLVVTSPGCGGGEGMIVWYSSNSGASFSNIYTAKKASSADLQPETITSAIFSTDGSRIIFGDLLMTSTTEATKNTVKEINPVNGGVTDLFTVDAAGVFVEGFDTKTQKVLYYSGCYFCDGNTMNKLFEHDIASKSDAILYEDKDHLGVSTVPNADLSKLVLVKGVQGEFLGAGKPYTVQEFTVLSKTTKDLVTVNEDVAPIAGYRDGDNSIYYTTGNSVFGYNGSAKPLTLFEATKPILNVWYVGKDEIVTSSGIYNDYLLTRFKVSNNTVNTILSGDDKTSIFGVVWK